jgi:DNA-binding NarL/FixJ family response regulator
LRQKKQHTLVYFIDNDDTYIRDVLSTFEEVNEFNIKIFSRSKDFFEEFEQMEFNKRKIIIVFVSTELEYDEENNQVNPLTVLRKIKQLDPYAEVILYSDDDNINIVSSAFHYGVYTFIKKNENIVLRIENNIKGIISQKNFLLKRDASRRITLVFLLFIALTAVSLLILYFLFPHWFLS